MSPSRTLRASPRVGVLLFLLLAGPSTATTFSVGPGRLYQRPSQVAALVQAGDVVEIDAGLYTGDVASWRADHLTLRGVGGMAHLEANGASAEQKAIWVIKGAGCIVENIEFSGARVPDRNGAGIRQEGPGVTVRHCYFHDNEMGILTGAGDASDVVLEFSEFAHSGYGDGFSHNIYIGHVRSFTMRYCYSHHSRVGHTVKSRASANYIVNNRIMDEQDGNSSYTIDLPNGGASYVIGNLLQQGPSSENGAIVSYGAEGATNPIKTLYFVNNTVVNDRSAGIFVQISASAEPAVLINNLFIGPGTIQSGAGTQSGSRVGVTADLVNRAAFDYRLSPSSPAINAGVAPGWAGAVDLTPIAHYIHPANFEPRCADGVIDIGAYESGCALNPPGDMNGNGRVDAADVPLFIAALIGFDPPQAPLADMNHDGSQNAEDLRLFLLAVSSGR